jgi:hypothetical protein
MYALGAKIGEGSYSEVFEATLAGSNAVGFGHSPCHSHNFSEVL